MIFDFSLDTQSIKWKIDWPRIILYYISYIMKMKIIYFCSINLVKISIRTLDITYKSQYSTICHQNCYSNLQNTQKSSLQLLNFIAIYSKRSSKPNILYLRFDEGLVGIKEKNRLFPLFQGKYWTSNYRAKCIGDDDQKGLQNIFPFRLCFICTKCSY